MKITIAEAEIKTAITDYIANQGFDLTDKVVEIDLKATRGDAGYTADIDITRGGEAPSTPVTDGKPVPVQKVSAPEPKAKVEETVEAPAEEETKDEAPAEEKPKTEAKASIFGNMKKPVNA